NGLTVIDTCKDAGCVHTGRSKLATTGNIVRFSGGRGLSVRDNADASFDSDYVSDNAQKGSVVETTGSVPVDGSVDGVRSARFRGVARVWNGRKDTHAGAKPRQEAVNGGRGSVPQPPQVEYGDAVAPGRNAFTSNRHASDPGPDDANFLMTNPT